MVSIIDKIWLKDYPQNYLIKKPIAGALVLAFFCFVMLMIYKPVSNQGVSNLPYIQTMAVYCLSAGLAAYIAIRLFKTIKWFSSKNVWNLLKEMVFIVLIMLIIGIVIYLLAFLLEPPSDRWNLATFFDSFKYGFFTGIIPFAFFTAINYQSLFITRISVIEDSSQKMPLENKIQIRSKLKKEELTFYPSQLIYAESDGNYVVFQLLVNGKIKQEMIRNSMSEVERQLSDFPEFHRTHRAFIVNLKKVANKKGNSSGYHLTLNNTEFEVPVSRQNTKSFDENLKKIQN
ncbi:LytR/AlgR family response regulator transcription factor [Draconibacterium halophilum]|uniref:LytTR family transcriptional regulator n=1 Tax=Draconibacterium halophilum TaxID=2706887 RepID=A0A6C0RG09_9BACT|nr:LytTR family DNA-binding domain-containing protein [Draconibacterium halophilum]QIA09350.1 LytTR family transcriptional regulator [Draconibacterium halophilum]